MSIRAFFLCAAIWLIAATSLSTAQIPTIVVVQNEHELQDAFKTHFNSFSTTTTTIIIRGLVHVSSSHLFSSPTQTPSSNLLKITGEIDATTGAVTSGLVFTSMNDSSSTTSATTTTTSSSSSHTHHKLPIHQVSHLSLSSLYLPTGLSITESDHIEIAYCVIESGVVIHNSTHIILGGGNDISNTNNGTCINIAACGNATTFTSCNITVHDNYVHDCRTGSGGSPYAPAAQGLLLGGIEGSGQCTVGVIVIQNDFKGIDEMGIRINNDNYASCILNNVTLNRVTDWGQLPQADGGDTRDSGCLYLYGHWFSPGNTITFNECVSTNSSWGQNGLYLDDSSSGQIVYGNVFRNATFGSPIKLNGGAYNVIHSQLVIGGINLGFGNCRGLRGPPSTWYRCPNNPQWMKVLEEDNYLQPPFWSVSFPWYTGWCTNTTAGPNQALCAPSGAPTGYSCEALSRGNSISRLAGVWMYKNQTNAFTIQTVPEGTYPNNTGACPHYVVDQKFNDIDWNSVNNFYDTDQFVDADAGDYTLRDDSQIYQDMPDFVRIPYKSIGPTIPPAKVGR